jgi:hypothetical protein
VGTAYLFSEDLELSWLTLLGKWGSYRYWGMIKLELPMTPQTYSISGSNYDGAIGLEAARLYNPNF